MTSSNGNIFRVTGLFVRGIHRSPVNSPHKGQWRGALMFSLICVWLNGWVNSREAGDLRCYRAHYDVTVMEFNKMCRPQFQPDDTPSFCDRRSKSWLIDIANQDYYIKPLHVLN